jgi:histidinol dehydrogenase
MRLIRHDEKDFERKLAGFCRGATVPKHLADSVASILEDVRRRGDRAVAAYAAKFDGARLRPGDFRASPDELATAARQISAADRKAILAARADIEAFNRRGLPRGWQMRNRHGAWAGEKFDPIRRVGLYVPGGEVPLVSTVLMTAVLARIAGCPEIAAFTPSKAGGGVAPGLLAALHFAGVGEVYRIGGVQAIGAMAFGTETIPAVDKIFGPGNAYVCEAKRQVFGTVGVDSLPGPSEVMVVADGSAPADWAAADLMAQAEHGSGREKIYLVSTSARVIEAVVREVGSQLASASRADKIRRVLADGFLAIQARSMGHIVEIANYVAPEHLELMVKPSTATTLARRITTAGAIMVGHETPTVLGDFVAGPSHVLPTARAGRYFGGLRVADFLRRTSLIRYDRSSLRRAAPTVAAFSAMERLEAHGRSAEIRLRE